MVGASAGSSGGAGDFGLAVAAMVAGGGVASHGGHGRALAGAGLVSVLVEGYVPDPMETVFDVPLAACPVGSGRLASIGGGQGDDQVGRLPGGYAGRVRSGPLPVWKFSSTGQRIPATRTSIDKVAAGRPGGL